MTREGYQKRVRETFELLQKWRGGYPSLWEYNVSLRRLLIGVTHDNLKGSLRITCLGCQYICGPVDGGRCDFELTVEDVTPLRSVYTLRDRANNFEVRCGDIGAMEADDPFQ